MPREFIHNTGDNLYPDGISAEDALAVLMDWILGEDWYCVDPLAPSQVNVIATHAMLMKVSPEYRRFRLLQRRSGTPKPKKKQSFFDFFKRNK